MDTDVKTPSGEAPQESPKPKIVRNREVDKAATALAEDHVLPLSPGKSVSWDQAQQYLALLTPGMWNHVLVYVYRIKPKIRRQLKDPNSPNYIDCLSEPFTMDYLISRHGGGKYSLQAVDTDGRKDSSTNQLFKCFIEINEVQHPPILNYEELELEARENKSYIAWLQNKGILDGKGNVITAQPNPAPAAASTSTNLSAKDVLDIMDRVTKLTTDQQNQFRAQFAPGEDSLSKSVGTILLEKMKQDDPGKVFMQMMAFVEKINKPDMGLSQVMQMQLEWTKLLLQDRNNNNNNNGNRPLGELRELILLVRELTPSGGSGRRSNWDTGLELARDVVLPGLQTLGTTITNIMALRGGAAPVAATPPGVPRPPAQPRAFDPYANPAAMRQYSTTMNAQEPVPQPQPVGPPPPPPPPPGAPGGELLGLFQQYGNLIVNALNNGTPGYDFADYIVGLMGTATHAMITSQGEEALGTTMMMIPEIAIFGEQRIRAFVNEFVHYQEYLEGQEPQAEEEPEPLPEVEMPMPKVYQPHRPPQRATTINARPQA